MYTPSRRASRSECFFTSPGANHSPPSHARNFSSASRRGTLKGSSARGLISRRLRAVATMFASQYGQLSEVRDPSPWTSAPHDPHFTSRQSWWSSPASSAASAARKFSAPQ
jgi:hypothetical protein